MKIPAAAVTRQVLQPETLFLALALSFGATFCLEIPPLAGGNETFNFGRAVGIAYGRFLVGDVAVPGGLVRLIDTATSHFTEASVLPLGVTPAYLRTLGSIRLMAEAPAILPANPIAVLNPLAYAPQAAVIRTGAWFGLAPLTLFYAARCAGFICAVILTTLAITRIPSHRYLLTCIALLPPLAFTRSTIDADQLTVSVSLLFIASVWRAMLRATPARAGELCGVALLAFMVAQCKSAYFAVPLIALAMPNARFSGRTQRLAWMAAIILPGAICNFGYLLALKEGYFAHLAYHTWAGDADPAMQIASILSAPLSYLAVLLRTLFLTPLLPVAVIQMFGMFGPPVMLPGAVTMVLGLLVAAVAVTDPTSHRHLYGWRARMLAMLVVGAVLGCALTLLYIQWNGVGAAVIEGFQGRYMYPVLLLPLMSLRSVRPALLGLRAGAWMAAACLFGQTSALAVSIWAYYA